MIAPGTRLGTYEIVGSLGAGGMGEVYRARDTTLHRDVAVKVLPEGFQRDPDRRARFEREARLLAALNHPHIATIHGLQESDEILAIVLELVEGPTLDRIGPVSVPAALGMARQIAEALDAAHEKGIVHRDLKPSNVKLTPAGVVKVLDFGLAKALGPESGATEPTASPTISAVGTRAGVVLGTAAYMSPEQARGAPVDKRADIWAFGCVLYELLSGLRAFQGATAADTISSILSRDVEWSALPADTPPSVRRLLRRCLEKDASRRLRDIGDARPDLTASDEAPEPAAVPQSRAGWRVPRSAVLALAAVSAGLGGLLAWSLAPRPQPLGVRHLALPLPAGHILNELSTPFALSNDGARLVYAAGSYQGSQLFVKSLDGVDVTPISGTLGAMGPVFSPDDRWIAFKSGTVLKKVPASGGAPVTLGDTANLLRTTGASWTSEGIFFSTGIDGRDGIARVPADGGTPERVTTVESRTGEVGHVWPDALPGGRAVLFTILTTGPPVTSQAAIQVLATGERRVLVHDASRVRFVRSGHLVFSRGADILAVAFDLGRLETAGEPVRVLQGTAPSRASAAPEFTIARDGTLVYAAPVAVSGRSLVWTDRQGVATLIGAPHRAYAFPALAPDGLRIAVRIAEPAGTDLWVFRPGGALNRLTSAGTATNAIWTPDGEELTYGAREGDAVVMLNQGAAPGALQRTLFAGSADASGIWPGSWSADGRTLTFMQGVPGPTTGDILSFDTTASGPARPYLQTEATEWGARLSPDGRWLAYVSNDSGQWEVYVRPYPGPGNRVQVSVNGGAEVAWARSGRELFYRRQQQFIGVPIHTTPVLEVGAQVVLFEAPFVAGEPGLPNYDVSPDGTRFLMVKAGDEEAPGRPLNIVLNWHEALQRLAPLR